MGGLSFFHREISPAIIISAIFIMTLVVLATLDYFHDFVRLWDFRVYLKASDQLHSTGSPYFEAESLRFIYPPSSLFILYLINQSAFYKSAYFVISGAAWIATTAVFCRRPIQLLLVLPIFLLAFGKHGTITILTGNIACLMYFAAALSAWLYHSGKISTVVFAICLLPLVMIKPFYAEFLIFVWFFRGVKTFLLYSAVVVGLFFAVNLLVWPELFSQFLSALRYDAHDSEIFGITLFSHFTSLDVTTHWAALAHISFVGALFILFLTRVRSLTSLSRFCCMFILAVFLNPKHVTYDLLVALPPLLVLQLEIARRDLKIPGLGLGIIIIVSAIDLGISNEPYFQWWYGFLAVFFLALLATPTSASLYQLPNLIMFPRGTHLHKSN